MKTVSFVLVAVAAFAQTSVRLTAPAAAVTIDGKAGDAFWNDVPSQNLLPAERGVPAAMGGHARAAQCGGYLCVLAQLPEAGGKVLARSMGRNPVWDKDATFSPPLEDRFRLVLETGAGDLAVEVNPWGAHRTEQNGHAVYADVMAASTVGASEWTVELAVPLAMLTTPPSGLRLERIRSRRPLAPEYHWVWPESGSARLAALSASAGAVPRFEPPVFGNREAPVEIGRVLSLPPLSAEWDDPAWSAVPSFRLPRAAAAPGEPRYATDVRMVHDGRTLAVLMRAAETQPVVARAGGRDSAVASDDHVGVRLAVTGSALVEFAVNTVGAIQDTLASGPRIERPQATWNAAGVETWTNIRYGAWTARINIPLAECAAALGEAGVPHHWRIAISRYRAPRPGDAAEWSAVPAIGPDDFLGPALYRPMTLSDSNPRAVAAVRTAPPAPRGGALAAALAAMDPDVWSPVYRRAHSVRTMLNANQRARVTQELMREREQWDRVRTKEDWEQYRDTRLKALRASIGVFPPERAPLDTRVTGTREGAGYRIQNLVYQTRPGFYAAANLYLPASSTGKLPVIVIQHSQHFPRTQGELHDMGELWARKGAAVLLLERIGYGERAETTPRYRQAYASRFMFRKQLNLVGESHMAWMAWDIIRAVDLLTDRPDIDPNRIVLIGAVAGGGEPAALAAALDPRITAVVPYNSDEGHVRLDADYPGEIPNQISPWFITASRAPRRYVRAFEFSWEGAEEPDYPDMWFSGWERSRKVWDLYGAPEDLAGSQAWGLIRLSMERIQHCFNIGPAQRRELFPIFEKWFGIPSAAREDAATLPDSELTYHLGREAARVQEAGRRRPHADLLCIPPSVAAELPRKPLHQLAREMAVRDLETARTRRGGLAPEARAAALRQDLASHLGTIDPAATTAPDTLWTRPAPGASVEAAAVHVERGIDVPLLLLKPDGASTKLPVVVAIAQAGKAAFLAARGAELEKLLAGGAAVCLPDLRGTGETSPDPIRSDHDSSAAQLELALGGSLPGARMRDLRSVIAWLRTRADVDPARVAVWGDSFAPANPSGPAVDTVEWQAGPDLAHQAEPGGALVAMLAGLYDERIRAVAALGGLAEFLSVLDGAFTHVPADALIHGALTTADIPDIAAALAPRPLLIADCRDGRNVAVPSAKLDSAFGPLKKSYAALKLDAAAPPAAVADWLLAALRN